MLSTTDTVLLASAVNHVAEARNAAESRGDSASVDHLNIALIALSVVEANGTGMVSYRVNPSPDAVTACGCLHPVHGGFSCDLPSVVRRGGPCRRCQEEGH